MRLKLLAILLVLTLLTGCAGSAFNQVKSGEFRVSIGSDGKTLYEGNGVGLSGFTVNIPEDGICMIEVKGRNGSGSLNFSVQREN